MTYGLIEPVSLSNLPAQVLPAADDEDGLVAVLVDERAEDCVRLDELVFQNLRPSEPGVQPWLRKHGRAAGGSDLPASGAHA